MTSAAIAIGDDVQIGPKTGPDADASPRARDPARRVGGGGADCHRRQRVVGGDVIVLPGVSIGESTVVGAGAVVAWDLPANVVAVGNPPASSGPCSAGRARRSYDFRNERENAEGELGDTNP
jgi:acetyltransferase-like isoleucine patch superfamily enzyme